MTDNSLNKFKKLRGSIKRQLTYFENILKSINEETDVESLDLETRLDKHWKLWDEFQQVQDKIDDVATNAEEEAENDSERLQVQNRFYAISALAKKHLRNLSIGTTMFAPQNTLSILPGSRFELPKLQTPTFHGSYDTWLNFYESFKSMCHDNPSIPELHKFYYLKACLKDKAAEVIASLETTPENYTVAWELLKKRYDNRRYIVESHLKSLIETQHVSKEFSIQSFLDNVQKQVRALNALIKAEDRWDTLLVFIIKEKLNPYTKEKWEESLKHKNVPSFDEMITFLEHRALIDSSQFNFKQGSFQRTDVNKSNSRSHFKSKPSQFCMKTAVDSKMYTNSECPICKENHMPSSCSSFQKMSPHERYNKIKKTALCHNCLNGYHRTIDCRSTTCRKCQGRHHTLLHFEKQTADNSCPSTSVAATQLLNCQSLNTSQVILGTAIVDILNNKGEFQPCRVLLDSCSQCNSITEKLATALGLAKTRVDIQLKGAQNLCSKVNHSTVAKIKSRYTDAEINLSCLIFREISDKMPSLSLDKKLFQIPAGVSLADPDFCKPADIDLLIGAEHFYLLLRSGQIRVKGQPAVYQETLLGWIIAGRISKPCMSKFISPITCNVIKFQELPILWELGVDSVSNVRSSEELECEEHFQKNVQRTESGRYCVSLPFNKKRYDLGNSKNTAFQRLYSLERRFEKDSFLKTTYSECIQGYLKESHLTLVSNCEPIDQGFYLPHHAVVKSSSLTTKVRVVFDGSAKTSSGISLNDTLLVGPTIQEDLFSIITRFRCFRYALTADIEQMYRQIQISHRDSLFQKILWRESPQEPVKIYKLNTVTFGTACAPFLAIRTLHQLAEDERESFPTASTILKRDFYVDDLLTGAQTFQDAINLRDDLINLLKRGGFNLRKWGSNHPELIKNFPSENSKAFMTLNPTEAVKALGLHWDAASDFIFYTVNSLDSKEPSTKRSILSQISKLFDPLGLLGPTVVLAKILIQQLWKLQLEWDTPVPPEIQDFWIKFKQQLQLLNDVKFNRFILIPDPSEIQLHGFCDASEKAYGACLYLRSTNKQGKHHSALVCSKSRVAPLKATTLPRLELCAANLLAKLFKATIKAFPFQINKTYFWSDSTIVLNWINTPSHTLKTFVANRVAEIQAEIRPQDWRHVPTLDNPADLISRGQSPQEFLKNNLWSQGPQWLRQNSDSWPQLSFHRHEIPETKAPSTLSLLISQESKPRENEILRKFSNLKKLTIVLANCLRFIYNSKTKKEFRKTGRLSTDEYKNAFQKIIKTTQAEVFYKELHALSHKLPINSKSKLLNLNPFLESGLLKVGGRLTHAQLPESQKHPVILPRNHPITRLIIREEHVNRMHAGINATLYGVRETFWPIDGRNTTRHIIRQCVRCFRAKPRETNYLMGDLPKNRVSFDRPFVNVGVDYCGPFFIKERRHRNISKVKTYVSVFVCQATKAVHLELASDLTTAAFLSCLKRFFARRGAAHSMSSDNATNFVGANRELRDFYKQIESLEKDQGIQSFLLKKQVNWHFIPPRAPHFGGLWEAAVKSFKRHFTRITGNTLLTYEQLHTYVVEIEAILNSRPLTPLSSHPDDFLPLTPGHLLIGTSLTTFPQSDLRNIPVNRLSSWEVAQQMRHHFWERWHKEYLNEQISRSKWKTSSNQEDIIIGTLVVIKEDNLPPMSWKLGRITAVHPGEDGIIRAVTVQDPSGAHKRALKKLYPLPIEH